MFSHRQFPDWSAFFRNEPTAKNYFEFELIRVVNLVEERTVIVWRFTSINPSSHSHQQNR
jgi:hypothetical protein